MKTPFATLITLASLLLAAKPQTRGLKKKTKKECQGSLACERSATADSDAKPQIRALKKKPKKEECDENFCK